MCRKSASLIEQTPVPVTDPSAQFQALSDEISAALRNVLESKQYILGPQVEAFESEFAEYVGTQHAVGVANGTDGLVLALRALGVGAGDEVISVSHTAVATIAAIEEAGAAPVLIDVEEGFYTMDPSLLESALSPRTRAIVVVHLYGQAAQLDAIKDFCNRHGLALVEDVSQAHGAQFEGARLGSIGDVSVFSCYPTKNLGALGDAGIVVTNDGNLAKRVRRLRQYGWEVRNFSLEPGQNSRLDEIQAAVLRVKLRYLDDLNLRRAGIACEYTRKLSELGTLGPAVRANTVHAFHLFVVEVAQRSTFRELLRSANVETGIHYPTPVHLQPAYLNRVSVASSMNVTERLARRVVSLPMYPELSQIQLEIVDRALGGAREAFRDDG